MRFFCGQAQTHCGSADPAQIDCHCIVCMRVLVALLDCKRCGRRRLLFLTNAVVAVHAQRTPPRCLDRRRPVGGSFPTSIPTPAAQLVDADALGRHRCGVMLPNPRSATGCLARNARPSPFSGWRRYVRERFLQLVQQQPPEQGPSPSLEESGTQPQQPTEQEPPAVHFGEDDVPNEPYGSVVTLSHSTGGPHPSPVATPPEAQPSQPGPGLDLIPWRQ